MFRFLHFLLATFFVLGSLTVQAQVDTTSNDTRYSSERLPERKVFLSGYVKNLSSIAIPSWGGDWTFDNFIHNRLNFKWYASENITVKVEARTRFFFGESLKTNPQYPIQVNASLDYIKLGGEISKGNSYLLNSFIDRAYIDWSKNKWQVIAGKQRINWGKSYVWNPNDIFNAYSFFDFDYEERRGTDAILIKYNVGNTSTIEAVSNIESNFDSTTIASKYSFNKSGYDFQLIAGKYQTDLMTGAGWAGQIKGAGFKGEVSYFQPYTAKRLNGILVADLSLDYTLPSTLNFRLEGIFNSNPQRPPNNLFFNQPVTAKQLTFNNYSMFLSGGYDISPLIKFNVSSIWYIDDKSFFVNPTLTLDLNKNTEFLIAAQLFGGADNSIFGNAGKYVFTRLKWSF
jgi:hypothetical protein